MKNFKLNQIFNGMNFIKKYRNKVALLIFMFFLPVTLALADASVKCKEGTLCNPIDADSINEVIKEILEAVLKIGIPIIALAIIYCGFLFVAARGKPDEIKKAKSALLYTLIGAAILLGSWAIAQLISETVLAL